MPLLPTGFIPHPIFDPVVVRTHALLNEAQWPL